MLEDNRKESFQLLQLSDDSKSLSELELPEILPQRKRKIRRKTRSTGTHLIGRQIDGHHLLAGGHLHDDRAAICQNLGLWIAIFMSCGWLLILSYMTTVVYTENRRLEVQITKLSANSQNIPDALQKWHETSKYLAGNQTQVNQKIVDIRRQMDSLQAELNEVRVTVTKQHELIENRNKIGGASDDDLQTKAAVASIGAKIKDLSIDIDTLQHQMSDIQIGTQQNRQNITHLAAMAESIMNQTRITIASSTAAAKQQPELITTTNQNVTIPSVIPPLFGNETTNAATNINPVQDVKLSRKNRD